MSRALARVEDCDILRNNSRITFREGRYSYRITREGNRSIYAVTDGTDTVTAPLVWAFGLGDAGQTYLFERDGAWYESRVSFYNGINGLDRTIGGRREMPADLINAAGRELSTKEVAECFGCHATDAVHGFRVDFQRLIPGVQCENCHPKAALHVDGLKMGNVKAVPMPHLTHMTAEESSEFCGRCHRTWAQIVAKGPFGISNIRFQPYRLANSKCYNPADARIGCTACHDPHRDIDRSSSVYDAMCLSCHNANSASPGKTCNIAKADCPGCHMPKLELPGTHRRFTDHQIRIVRAGEPYPN